MATGYWELEVKIMCDSGEEEILPNASDREHIAEMIKQGYTEGQLVHNDD